MEILSCLVVAAALEAPAVRSRVSNPGARELERGATAGNAFPGLSADLPVPLAAGAMPPSRTVDIKLSFPQFNGEPGPDCRRFRRDLIQCGGQTDTHGASIADSSRATRTTPGRSSSTSPASATVVSTASDRSSSSSASGCSGGTAVWRTRPLTPKSPAGTSHTPPNLRRELRVRPESSPRRDVA